MVGKLYSLLYTKFRIGPRDHAGYLPRWPHIASNSLLDLIYMPYIIECSARSGNFHSQILALRRGLAKNVGKNAHQNQHIMLNIIYKRVLEAL